MRDTEAVAEGELLRYLAEAPWYPTALLPRPGIEWTEIDDFSARVTLAEGDLTVSMVYTFGDDGLVSSVQADARGRSVGGKVIPTPWRGEWWGYSWLEGILVPTAGEVSWILPEGAKPYWRGEVTSFSLTFRE